MLISLMKHKHERLITRKEVLWLDTKGRDLLINFPMTVKQDLTMT